MDLVAKKYIKALTEGASSEQKKEYFAILSGFAKAYEEPSVSAVLDSPLTPSEKKMELMQSFGDNTDKHMANFLMLVAQNDRFSALPSMADMLRLQLQQDANSYEGTIKASTLMDQAQMDALAQALQKKTGTNIMLKQVSQDYDGVQVTIADLGIEVGYSKQRIKDKLIDYVVKSF